MDGQEAPGSTQNEPGHFRPTEGGAAEIAHKVFEHFLDGELASMALFAGISPLKLRAITHLFELEEMPASGTTVFAQGATGDAFFILLHGQARHEGAPTISHRLA